jgi:hypothetical protein
MRNFSERIIEFINDIHFPVLLPEGIHVMNPFNDAVAKEISEGFYRGFYNDANNRWMIIGINPGRFGGGVTGIPFTDPIRLARECEIPNPWAKKQELSSVFIYEMIMAYGGVRSFYQKFYITAVSPLGFTKDNKNLNYYDDKTLMADIRPFVIECLERQLEFGINRNVCFCLGDGKNFTFVNKLNKEMRFFNEIIPLSHPRFIMQYRLKKKQEYINHYLSRFAEFCS